MDGLSGLIYATHIFNFTDLFINPTIWASFTNFECRRVASSACCSRHLPGMSPELRSINVHNWTKKNLLFSERAGKMRQAGIRMQYVKHALSLNRRSWPLLRHTGKV